MLLKFKTDPTAAQSRSETRWSRVSSPSSGCDIRAFENGYNAVQGERDLHQRLRGGNDKGQIRSYEIGARAAKRGLALQDALRSRNAKFVGIAALLAAPVIAIVTGSFVAPKQTEAVVAQPLNYLPEPQEVQKMRDFEACATLRPALDRTGNRIGYLPAIPGCSGPHYVTVLPDRDAAIEQAYFEGLIEGPASGPGVILSFSVTGALRAMYYAAVKGKLIGGTPMVGSAFEQAIGESSPGLRRKLALAFYIAPSFVARDLRDPGDRAVWAITNTQCARSQPGTGPGFTPLAGDLCAEIVGAESLNGLRPGHRCVIGAVRRDMLVVPGPNATPADIDAYETRWQAVKARAKSKCVDIALSRSEAQTESAAIDALVAPDPAHLRGLVTRTRATVPGAVGYTRDRMTANGDADPTGPFTIQVHPKAQSAVQRMVASRLSRMIGPNMDPRLCLPNTPGCSDSAMLDVGLLIASLDDTGRLNTQSVFQSRAGLLALDSPSVRSTASTTKALMVPLLLKHGIETVCREAWPGLRDIGSLGGDCADPANWMSIDTALAKSSNLAFLWALRQIPDADIRHWLVDFGFDIKPGTAPSELRHGVIIGNTVTISPDNLLRGLAAIATGQQVRGPDSEVSLDLTARYSGNVLARATTVLNRPVTHGTATAMAPILAGDGCDDFAIAKTGTADGNLDLARDRLLIAGATCGETRFFVFGLIGSPDPDVPLGTEIKGRHVVELVTSALTATSRALMED